MGKVKVYKEKYIALIKQNKEVEVLIANLDEFITAYKPRRKIKTKHLKYCLDFKHLLVTEFEILFEYRKERFKKQGVFDFPELEETEWREEFLRNARKSFGIDLTKYLEEDKVVK